MEVGVLLNVGSPTAHGGEGAHTAKRRAGVGAEETAELAEEGRRKERGRPEAGAAAGRLGTVKDVSGVVIAKGK